MHGRKDAQGDAMGAARNMREHALLYIFRQEAENLYEKLCFWKILPKYFFKR